MHELLGGFPAVTRAADAELAVVAAADELAQGSLEAAERYLTLAERNLGAGPAGARAWTGRATGGACHGRGMFRRSARAIQFDAYGGPEVLQLTGAAECPAP